MARMGRVRRIACIAFALPSLSFPVPHPALVFAIAFGATLVASMSGGSASLVTTPAWLFLGVPLPVAIGSDKLAGACRPRATTCAGGRRTGGCSCPWARLGLAGPFAGTRVAVGMDPRVLRPAVGAMLLGLVVLAFVRPAGGEERPPRMGRGGAALLGVPLGFYEGLLGSGNSVITSSALCGTRGMGLLRALGHYYVLAFAWCTFAAAVYVHGGWFDARLGIPSVLGSVAGGYAGSAMGARAGQRVVRLLFLATGALFGLRLLLGG
jgi:uncharacterized membrane protein YfcA